MFKKFVRTEETAFCDNCHKILSDKLFIVGDMQYCSVKCAKKMMKNNPVLCIGSRIAHTQYGGSIKICGYDHKEGVFVTDIESPRFKRLSISDEHIDNITFDYLEIKEGDSCFRMFFGIEEKENHDE